MEVEFEHGFKLEYLRGSGRERTRYLGERKREERDREGDRRESALEKSEREREIGEIGEESERLRLSFETLFYPFKCSRFDPR